MRRFKFTKIKEEAGRPPFWMPWGCGMWLLKSLLFVLLLLLFILLFCIPRCSDGGNVKDPVIVEPGRMKDIDTLLRNPNRPNPAPVPMPTDSTEAGNPVDWPRQIDEGDGVGERNPALPAPGDNKIPPTKDDDIVTDPRTGRQTDARHLIVVLNSDSGDETFNQFAEELSSVYLSDVCSIVYYNTLTKLVCLEVNPEQKEQIKTELPVKIPDIDFYVCDMDIFSGGTIPNDPAFSHPDFCWFYEPIQAYDAWDITIGDPGVKVAVVDSYFDLSHPDLQGVRVISPISLENGTDFVYPVSESGTVSFVHGTHVAGLIFAQMNNSEGIAGIAPKCSFIPVSLGHNMTTLSLIEGILYAVYQGADVVNASIGMDIPDEIARKIPIEDQAEIARDSNLDLAQLWQYVFKICRERNTTIVWSSGNSNLLSSVDYSKRDSTTVIVDAVDRNLRKADFSNFGNLPNFGFHNSTVSSPGTNITSTIPGGSYYPLDGTSMAAPIVTGAVALMKSVCRSLSNEDVISILKKTAKPLDAPSIGGLLQIRDAIDMIRDEFMRFDDIMKNHELLMGVWESTDLLYSTDDNRRLKNRFTFTSETDGLLEIIFLDDERDESISRAHLKVSFGKDFIDLLELSNPTSKEGTTFSKAILKCRPDRDGLLLVHCKQEEMEEITFHLRKIE